MSSAVTNHSSNPPISMSTRFRYARFDDGYVTSVPPTISSTRSSSSKGRYPIWIVRPATTSYCRRPSRISLSQNGLAIASPSTNATASPRAFAIPTFRPRPRVPPWPYSRSVSYFFSYPRTMSRVASVLSESITRISNGGSCVTRLSRSAAMFRASLRTVVTTERSNVARNLRPDMMVSGLCRLEATFNSVPRILARPVHGPHRHDHRDPAGDHQDGPGREGSGPAVARPRPRARRHEHDRGRRPPREQARAHARPRRGGHPLVRQDDARGSQPDHRRPAIRLALRPDAHRARQPATGKRPARRVHRREQRDRRVAGEPRARLAALRHLGEARPPPAGVPPPDVPPRGERGRSETTRARVARLRRGREGLRPSDRLPHPSPHGEEPAAVRARETRADHRVAPTDRADRVPRYAPPREGRRADPHGFGRPPGGRLLFPRAVRDVAGEHGAAGDPLDPRERPCGDRADARRLLTVEEPGGHRTEAREGGREPGARRIRRPRDPLGSGPFAPDARGPRRDPDPPVPPRCSGRHGGARTPAAGMGVVRPPEGGAAR